jgi:hypothetical protein
LHFSWILVNFVLFSHFNIWFEIRSCHVDWFGKLPSQNWSGYQTPRSWYFWLLIGFHVCRSLIISHLSTRSSEKWYRIEWWWSSQFGLMENDCMWWF